MAGQKGRLSSAVITDKLNGEKWWAKYQHDAANNFYPNTAVNAVIAAQIGMQLGLKVPFTRLGQEASENTPTCVVLVRDWNQQFGGTEIVSGAAIGKLPPETLYDLTKQAVFDYIIGNSDRQESDILFSQMPDGGIALVTLPPSFCFGTTPDGAAAPNPDGSLQGYIFPSNPGGGGQNGEPSYHATKLVGDIFRNSLGGDSAKFGQLLDRALDEAKALDLNKIRAELLKLGIPDDAANSRLNNLG